MLESAEGVLLVIILVTSSCYVRTYDTNVSSSFFGGGGSAEEEERTPKGDDVIVELDATLEDLYMGGSLKVGLRSRYTIHSCLTNKKNIMLS